MQKSTKFQGGHGKFEWKSRGLVKKIDTLNRGGDKIFFWKSPLSVQAFPFYFYSILSIQTLYPFLLIPFSITQKLKRSFPRDYSIYKKSTACGDT